jgi:hypothetical protein
MTPVLCLHGFASEPSSSKARYLRQRLQNTGARLAVPDLAAGDFEHLTKLLACGLESRAERLS